MGLDPALVDAAIAYPTAGEEVIADHQRVVGAFGYGVPARLFPEGQCLFGPVLIDPPIGEAVRLWDAADARTEFPHLYELQGPKTPADEAAIAETLRPHLQARGRGSTNRGEVVRFPDADADADAGAAVGGQGR